MKIKFVLITTIGLLVIGAKAFAQEDSEEIKYQDYIVKINNDTVRCEITNKLLSKAMRYRVAGKKDYHPINADSIKAYYLSSDSSHYGLKYLPSNGNPEFVKFLEQGRLNLCEFTALKYDNFVRSYAPSICWYVGKATDDTLKLIRTDGVWPPHGKNVGTTSRKIQEADFISMLADNSDLAAHFKDVRKSTDYDWDLIRAYVKIYNNEYVENHKAAK
jgi:hypothetical protein